ncbi:MAG: hypothetical protein I8H75_00660 [Myxococcaceae bacterium]|nr:hypothetical protein [Myxococcaceae bacterium]MBH2005853.1 hypothetical protein [Myxococcaceae bacterium]
MKHYYGLNPSDSVGNRRPQKEMTFPNEDIGNQRENPKDFDVLHDQLGNSVDLAPTHQLSGLTYRKKSEQAPWVRMGRYIVGGVNPVVAGLAHLIPDPQKPAESSEAAPNPNGDKRLRRLFELDDDDRVEFTLTSTPEDKCAQAKAVVESIFQNAKAEAFVEANLELSDSKPSVQVFVRHPAFKTGELPLATLNFLTHKIVNRLPSDRIRLTVLEAP